MTSSSSAARQTAHRPRRMARFLVLGTVLSVLGFAVAVWSICRHSNLRAEADSLRLVAASLGDLQADLSKVSDDYNHWNEAFDAMERGGDLKWIYDNYAISTHQAALFDGVIFIGGPFRSPAAWSAADPREEPSASFLPPDVLTAVERDVSQPPVVARDSFDTMVVLDGQLVLLSAARVQPFDPARLDGVDPASLPIAVLTRTLDRDTLSTMAGSLFLKDLSFDPGPMTGRTSLPVADAQGRALGHLNWTPPRPGTEIVATMAPVLVGATLIFVLFGALAAWLAGHLASAEGYARRIALHDPLTGLPNRRCFHQHLESMSGRAQTGAQDTAMTVLLLDLDRFKPVNDLRGHQVGDRLLREVAARLRRICPDDALVVRLGGDEFAIVLHGATAGTHSALVADEILRGIEEPFDFGDWSALISCSIGIADWIEGASSSDLLRQADQAMYRAKQAGRAGWVHYDSALGEAVRERAALEQDLLRALDQGAINPYFQPIYDVEGGGLRGVEILARWLDPVRGFVPPTTFVGLAEELGLIDRLSDQVFDKACAAVAAWSTGLPISFNLSPLQLSDIGLPARILGVLGRHGIRPTQLEVEITERAVLKDMEVARQVLTELSAAGVRISLDDFGTGTSSLAMLTQLPISKLKIDRTFVAEVDRQPSQGKIVAGVLSLAQSLDLQVTAEGIERDEELAFLRERHCDLAQGFLLGRPRSADRFADLLREETGRSVVPLLAFARR